MCMYVYHGIITSSFQDYMVNTYITYVEYTTDTLKYRLYSNFVNCPNNVL